MFPTTRLRRLRQTPAIRALVRETTLTPENFIAPLFVVPGTGVRREIASLPGQYHLSTDSLVEEVYQLQKLGVPGVLLFGLPDRKDENGDIACADDGIVQTAIRAVKRDVPKAVVMADLCFCEYTTHGHCGVLKGETLDNDLTLTQLQKQAVSLARAGVDVVAPSGMIDGMVGAIRSALDEHALQETLIMSYAAKFASNFYGPFREAVASAPSFGDRQSYQMDPANGDQALREIALDVEEGADIIMVKPALPYLDIVRRARDHFKLPVAAYNVSGEYAMIKAAAERNLIDGEMVMMESLVCMKRAGADIIISYFSREAAALLQ